MPFPRLSALFNNCALHALTPEICAEVKKYAVNTNYDNQHNPEYLRLKGIFADYYGFGEFDWEYFAEILDFYNPFDAQLILGPVLRVFMKESLRRNEFTPWLAEVDGISLEQYIDNYTETSTALGGRYRSLAPDELSTHVASPLGLSLCYHPQEGETQQFRAENPIAEVTIYHVGDLEGKASGHWERVANVTDPECIDYQHQESTQLACLIPLLGQEQALNVYGKKLVQDHIQLVACGFKTAEDIELTSLQITKYLTFIQSVPKQLAIELLGDDITDYTSHFIRNYRIPRSVGRQGVYETYIKTFNFHKPHLSAAEQDVVTHLLSGLSKEQKNALSDRTYFAELNVKARQIVQRAVRAMKDINVDFSRVTEVDEGANRLLNALTNSLQRTEQRLNDLCKFSDRYPELKAVFDIKSKQIQQAALARKRELVLTEIDFDIYLNAFQEQAIELRAKSIADSNCRTSAGALHTFVIALTEAKKTFLSGDTNLQQSKLALKKACEEAVAVAAPLLIDHPDWTTTLINFLMHALAMLCRGLGFAVNRWTIFNENPEKRLNYFKTGVIDNPVFSDAEETSSAEDLPAP